MRLLIVEDDPLMQLGLEQALSEQSEFEIVGKAEDGFIAVQQAIALKPDLIVMDIGLPRLDGIAATKQIKAQIPQIHVIMLTSHVLETEVIALDLTIISNQIRKDKIETVAPTKFHSKIAPNKAKEK